VDRTIADEVVDRADALWHQRMQDILKSVEVAVQNGVAQAFGAR